MTAVVNSEELSLVQSSIDEVITMLQQSPGLPSVPGVSSVYFVCLFFLMFTVGNSFVFLDRPFRSLSHEPDISGIP